jgi:hypothetical protein
MPEPSTDGGDTSLAHPTSGPLVNVAAQSAAGMQLYYCATYTAMDATPECEVGFYRYGCGCSSMSGPKDETTNYINQQQLKNLYTSTGGCTDTAGCDVAHDADAQALGGEDGHIRADDGTSNFQTLWADKADEWTRFTSVQAYAGFEESTADAESHPWNYGKAVQQYLNDCNRSPSVDGDGISTILMVWVLFALAVVELLLLLKIGVFSLVFKPKTRATSSARIPVRVSVAVLLSWILVLFTFSDIYGQASKLRDTTDAWGCSADPSSGACKATHELLGMSCAPPYTEDSPDCVAKMCHDKYVLPTGIFSGDPIKVQQFSFCWGMWTLSEIDEALYAGNFVAMLVSIVSSVSFMLKLRGQAAKLLTLVGDKYDPIQGWQNLTSEEMLMISPSTRGDGKTAHYRFAGTPYYVGVYVASVGFGYMLWLGTASMCAWVLIMSVSLVNGASSWESTAASFAVVLLPLITQIVVQRFAFFQAINKKRGLDHPRIWAGLDFVVSVTSIVTGPLLIVPRLLFSAVSLAWHLLRLDLDVLLDEKLELVDYASSANQGLWTALRLQYEFDKRQQHDADHGTFEMVTDGGFEMKENPAATEEVAEEEDDAQDGSDDDGAGGEEENDATASGSGSDADESEEPGGLYG